MWLHPDGRIIDGRNRWRACAIAGVEPTTRTYRGDESGLVAFVVSLNLKRRHLNESQRAMIAARVANMGEGRPAETRPIGLVSQSAAADLLNVGERSLKRAKAVQEHGTSELVEAVDRGDVAVSTAAVIARESEQVQREVVEAFTDPEAVDLLDQALQNPIGTNMPVDNVNNRPDGNSKARALRRLRKDAPELHAEVLAGRLKAHAAMVQAGFRPKTVSVPVARPEAVARPPG